VGGHWLADRLQDTGIVVKKSPQSVGIGAWWPQIRAQIKGSDYVIVTFTRDDFGSGESLVKFREWREAIRYEEDSPRKLIVPVFLDGTQLEELERLPGIDLELVDQLKDRQCFWVTPQTGENFEMLHDALKKGFRDMRQGRSPGGTSPST
jgi:hypothetical protein